MTAPDNRALNAYRAAAAELDEQPAAATRAAILAAAARAVDARPRLAGTKAPPRGWRLPLAAAATVLVSTVAVMLAQRTEQEMPTLTMSEGAPQQAKPELNTVPPSARPAPQGTAAMPAQEGKQSEARDSVATAAKVPSERADAGDAAPREQVGAARTEARRLRDVPPKTAAEPSAPAVAEAAPAAVPSDKRDEQPATGRPAPLPSRDAAVGRSEAKSQSLAEAPGRATTQGEATTLGKSTTQRAAMTQDAAVTRETPSPPSAVPAAPPSAFPQAPSAAPAEKRTERDASAADAAAGALASVPEAAAPRPAVAASQRPVAPGVAVELSPERWIARIIELRRTGRDDDADLELKKLREAYPAFTIPEAARRANRPGTR